MYNSLKRILDIIGGIVGLVLFSPVILITAIFIKLVSHHGPIFADTPKRVGQNGVEFRMYKFRTMIPNAHQFLLDNPELYEKYKKNNFKLDPDPRWLPGANFIRKFSIDELPQFINILIGNMSLVGPRAYYPFELRDQQEIYPETAPHIQEVQSVKPGLTGLWQVSGRSGVSFPDRIKMDSYYSRKRSIVYDMWLLIKTPVALLSGRGAC